MEDEEVAMVDGVFEGAFSALGDESCGCFGEWVLVFFLELGPLVDEEVEEVGDSSLEAIEDDEVALVDGVFEGAFGALGDESCLLEGLEVEALVDVIEVMVIDDK
ncbi:hypothetical protein Tco_0150833 [Tanacetum coccineum]